MILFPPKKINLGNKNFILIMYVFVSAGGGELCMGVQCQKRPEGGARSESQVTGVVLEKQRT